MLTRYNFQSGGFFPADNGMWIKYDDLERLLSKDKLAALISESWKSSTTPDKEKAHA